MRRTHAIIAIVGAGLLVALTIVTAGPLMSQVEQPTYQVQDADGRFEVRTYPPMIVAQVTTTGDRRSAISAGFKSIAGYIFGGNASHQKVAMTAPVMQQSASDAAEGLAATTWTVRFVMPRDWSLATLPRPGDPTVTLAEQPAGTFAVVRFSGLASRATLDAETRALEKFIVSRKLHATAPPILAFFNPPWTLPFLRRNEVMIAVQPG